MYLPQSANSDDILSVTEYAVNRVVEATCASSFKYGNGFPIYNLDIIQFNLLSKIVGKKMFVLDKNLYLNVRFIGETFSKQGKFSDYISHIRKLGLNSPVPSLVRLEAKFKEIKEKSKNEYYSVLKKLLGSLEKLVTFYKNLVEKNIKLSDYIRKYKFSGISSLITDEAPIKDYDISTVVSLYEWTEKEMMPTIWKVLAEDYKAKLSKEERENVKTWLLRLKDGNNNKEHPLPDLVEFSTALGRFVSRCLLLDDFKPDAYLTDWLYEREDFWSYPFKDEAIENLSLGFPRITFSKIFDLNETIQAIINPFKEIKPTQQLGGERIPDGSQTKPQRRRAPIMDVNEIKF